MKLGYAVVATDYTGLGTDFRNAAIDMQSNAADVIYSVAAAHAAVPQLGRKWIAMGESAGGLAALAIAGLESDIRDPDYLGSHCSFWCCRRQGIPTSRPAWTNSPEALLFLAYGVQTLYPRFQADQILSKEALAPYSLIERSCAATAPGPQASCQPDAQAGMGG